MSGTFRKLIIHAWRAAFIKMCSFFQLLCVRVQIFQGFAHNPKLCIYRALKICVGHPENLRYNVPGTFRKLIIQKCVGHPERLRYKTPGTIHN
jgi:hypothetical protein